MKQSCYIFMLPNYLYALKLNDIYITCLLWYSQIKKTKKHLPVKWRRDLSIYTFFCIDSLAGYGRFTCKMERSSSAWLSLLVHLSSPSLPSESSISKHLNGEAAMTSLLRMRTMALCIHSSHNCTFTTQYLIPSVSLNISIAQLSAVLLKLAIDGAIPWFPPTELLCFTSGGGWRQGAILATENRVIIANSYSYWQ